MKKSALIGSGLIILAIIVVVSGLMYTTDHRNKTRVIATNEEAPIRALVTSFGKKLQNVSLLASKKIAAQAIQDNYAQYVSPDVLSAWKDTPSSAPGRLTSSPWPDHITINSIEKLDDGSFLVHADVVNVTTDEATYGGYDSLNPVTISVEKDGENWVITGIAKGTITP